MYQSCGKPTKNTEKIMLIDLTNSIAIDTIKHPGSCADTATMNVQSTIKKANSIADKRNDAWPILCHLTVHNSIM